MCPILKLSPYTLIIFDVLYHIQLQKFHLHMPFDTDFHQMETWKNQIGKKTSIGILPHTA